VRPVRQVALELKSHLAVPFELSCMSITTFACRHRVAFVPFFKSEGNLAFFWLEVSKLLFSSCQYVLCDVVSREHVNYEPKSAIRLKVQILTVEAQQQL
jgi:hypothetical protein